jgi:hypothetical protein
MEYAGSMNYDDDAPTRIVGRRPGMSGRRKVVPLVLLALYLAFVGWAVSKGQWSSTALLALFVWNTAAAFRRPTVVQADGVTRHWRLRHFVKWTDVERVAARQPGIERVRLWMKDGKTITLDDIPVEESAAVAAIGGIPLGYPDNTPERRPGQRTARDAEADVDRRARSIHERGKVLDAKYRRLTGTPPDEHP